MMRWPRRGRIAAGALAAAAVMALTAACGGSGGSTPAASTITLYNASHEELGKAWADEFTRRTGIQVQIRNGSDSELANQIVTEGQASPADVFLTENSPAMTTVSNANLLAPVDQAARAQVPAQYASSKGDWVGVAARSTALVYNRALLPADQLPTRLADLAAPQWQGRFGFPPGGADFQAIASAYNALNGDAATAQWLAGLKANGKTYRGNSAVMQAVNRGEIPAGIIYHYYWFQDRAESGANSANTDLQFFTNNDAGGFLSVSGGGVLSSSKNPAAAQQFLAFVSGAGGQRVLATSKNLEYTLGAGVPANPSLKPFAELAPPRVDVSTLNGPKVVQMMQQAGLL